MNFTAKDVAALREQEAKSQRAQTQQAAPHREKQRELRMSYKEQKDYETIDARIEQINEKIAMLDDQIQQYASDFVKLTELSAMKEAAEKELEEAEERWLYLSDLAERIEAQKKG